MSREIILEKVRSALGRSPGQPPAEAPATRLRIPEVAVEERLDSFRRSLEALAGKFYLASSREDARRYVAALIEGRTAVASNSPYLAECGIAGLPGVRTGFAREAELREACASAGAGVTSADYALADTGTLVLLSSAREARMVSLLPPLHVAVIPREIVLTTLDELLTLLPCPADATSSMLLITGPSRTADIEQILVRGVHGPGEVHVVVI
ncbi:MAG: lactate utilization protein [Acidobacteria bacterium]|nr:lactate utilization protein [Acidobacteriota bacterium]